MSTALHAPHAHPGAARPTGATLTARERVVLARLRDDRTLRQIAAELYVTRNTVKSQVRSVYRKLGVSTRAEAVERSLQDGLIPTPRRGPTGVPGRRG